MKSFEITEKDCESYKSEAHKLHARLKSFSDAEYEIFKLACDVMSTSNALADILHLAELEGGGLNALRDYKENTICASLNFLNDHKAELFFHLMRSEGAAETFVSSLKKLSDYYGEGSEVSFV